MSQQNTTPPSPKAIIVRQLDTMPVGQRITDGYINATAMCRVVGKDWYDYARLKTTVDFLEELSRSTGIPGDLLTHSVIRGANEQRGTWVHPQVAVNLAQVFLLNQRHAKANNACRILHDHSATRVTKNAAPSSWYADQSTYGDVASSPLAGIVQALARGMPKH